MNNSEYIDIATFSSIVGISKQAVYTSKRLKAYLKKEQGKLKVSVKALKEVYEIDCVSEHEDSSQGQLARLQKEYTKLYNELESLRKYKAERNELDKKVLVALERARADREIKEMLLEQKKKDDVIIQDLLERNRKQADLLEQANILKALELKKDTQ